MRKKKSKNPEWVKESPEPAHSHEEIQKAIQVLSSGDWLDEIEVVPSPKAYTELCDALQVAIDVLVKQL